MRHFSIGVIFLTLATPALAVTGVQVNISRPLTLYSLSTRALSATSTSSPVSLSSTSAFGDELAYADFGVVKVAATMKGKIKVPDVHVPSIAHPYPSDQSTASAFWQDDLVITGASGSGFVDVSLFIDATMSTQFPSAEGTANTNLSLALYKTDSGQCSFCGPTWTFGAQQVRYRNPDGTTSQLGSTNISSPVANFVDRNFPTQVSWAGWQYMSIPITFGQTFEIRVQSQCFTSGDTGVFNGGHPITQLSGASVNANCDMGNSVYWGGISAVRSSSGALVSNYGLTSGSGFDYRLASPDMPTVPEPSSWTLLISGFGVAGTAMRRRRAAAA